MTQAYFNSQAEIWDEKNAEKDLSKLEILAQKLDIQPGSTVLDVGTGTGVLVPFLLNKLGDKGKLVCLDHAEKMLKKARQKNFPGNIEYVCSDISNTKFEDSMFDGVVCYSSFPHFQDKLQALKEIRRVLKQGGQLFICHTSSRSVINKIHQRVPVLAMDILPDEEELQGLLLSAGFTNIDIQDEVSSYFAKAEKPSGRIF